MAPVMEAAEPEAGEEDVEGSNGSGRRRAFLNAKDEASAKLDEITGAARSTQEVTPGGNADAAVDQPADGTPSAEPVDKESGVDR
jgi:hypothetical protein